MSVAVGWKLNLNSESQPSSIFFRYQQLQDKPVQALGNIKKLLGFCKDVKLHYKLARDLGIKELITNLEKGDSRSYYQDFVSTLS